MYFDNNSDIIDSRDVIVRIEELEELEELEEIEEDEKEELESLQALAEQGESYGGDWQYGSTLIRDSYFEEYAQDYAESCGAMNDSMSWPYTYIDWEGAANELQMDYTSIDFNGVDYWVR